MSIKQMKNKSGFFKFMIIYVAVAVVLISVGLVIFWGFIKAYEEGMPYNAMKTVMNQFNTEDIGKLVNSDTLTSDNEFENSDAILDEYKKLIDGKEITFEEAKDYTDKNPVYLVKADKKSVAEITLVEAGRNNHHFKVWKFGSISISDYMKDTTTITITAPSNMEVMVNNIKVSDKYKNSDTTTIPALQKTVDYVDDLPDIYTYTIKGFVKTPVVTATNGEGEASEVTCTQNSYNIGFKADSNLEKSQMERVKTVVEAYGLNFINMSKDVYKYILRESVLYTDLKSTTTAFYPNSKISGYEYQDMKIDNFIRYADDCFSCDISYNLHVTLKDYTEKEANEPGSYTFVFVKQNEVWYLADYILK